MKRTNKAMKKRTKRPPLGLVPKWVRREERYFEVCEAIVRYYEAGQKIPVEWVKEYNELVDDLNKRKT